MQFIAPFYFLEKCLSLIFVSFVLDMYFFFSLLLAHIKRKRSTKKKRNQLGYQNSSSSLCPVGAFCLSCVADCFYTYVILKKENEPTNKVSRVNFFCSGSGELALINGFAGCFLDAETSSA